MPGPTALLLRAFSSSASLEPGWTNADPPDAAALADLASRAWYWPEGKDALLAVRSAIRFESTAAAPSPLDAALLATAQVAAKIDDDVIAVIWETTALVHDAKGFVDQATDAQRDDLPLYLWVRFEGTKGDDGTLGMRTLGLVTLGAMEVEVEGSKRDGEHILECVTDVALFLAAGGAAPEDGETIEVTRGELRVRRMPSLRGDGSIALRVRM